MKKIIGIIIVFFIWCTINKASYKEQYTTNRSILNEQKVEYEMLKEHFIDSIVHIYDSDTYQTTKYHKIRPIGINTPEWFDPYSDSIKAIVSSLILNKRVELEFDRVDKDKYDRVLVHIWVLTDSSKYLLSHHLLSLGFGDQMIVDNNDKYPYYRLEEPNGYNK